MLTYQLDDDNKYYSLYKCIRGDILRGVLKKGDRLPSKRALAADLGISVTTVRIAYEQLLAEGYILSRERSGYFVADMAAPPLPKTPPPPSGREAAPAFAYDLVSAPLPPELFPFSVWARLMRSVLTGEGEHLLERVPCRGDASLRREIAACLYRTRGVTVDPDSIVVGAGAEYLYDIVVRLVGREGLYAVENPGHTKIYSTYCMNGVRCLPVPVGGRGADCNFITRSNARLVHISPSHQFPTGAVMPVADRLKIIEWARSRGAYIVEDDYDSEFRLVGKPLQSMLGLCPDRVIYLNTFSRSLAPSMRMGYMVLPPQLLKRYLAVFSSSANVVPLFEQKALAAMIGGGHFERHINRLKTHYRAIRREVVAAVACLPFACEVGDTGSGLHLTVRFPGAPSDEHIREEAAKRGVNLRCLGDYLFAPAEGHGGVAVINYGGLREGDAARIAALFLYQTGIKRTCP